MKKTFTISGLALVIITALAVAFAPSCGGSDATDAAAGGDGAAADGGAGFDGGGITDTGVLPDTGVPDIGIQDGGQPDGSGTFMVNVVKQQLPAGVVPSVLEISGDPDVYVTQPTSKYLYIGDAVNSKIHALFKRAPAADTIIDFPTPSNMSVNYLTGAVAVTGGNAPKLGLIDPANGNTITTIDIPDDTGTLKVRPVLFEQANKEVYVLNPNKGTLTVVDLNGAAPVVTEAAVGSKPIALDVDRANRTVIVVNSGDNTVSLVKRPDNTVKSVAVGLSPVAVRYVLAGSVAFIANSGESTLTKVDTVGGTAAGTITVGLNPVHFGFHKSLNLLYVVNSGDNTVTIMALNSGKVSTVTVGAKPISVVLDESIPMIFVANNTDSTVSIIDYWKNNQIYTYPLTGQGPTKATVDVDTGTIFIFNDTTKDITVLDGYKHSS